jgi:hypothetical protein
MIVSWNNYVYSSDIWSFIRQQFFHSPKSYVAYLDFLQSKSSMRLQFYRYCEYYRFANLYFLPYMSLVEISYPKVRVRS